MAPRKTNVADTDYKLVGLRAQAEIAKQHLQAAEQSHFTETINLMKFEAQAKREPDLFTQRVEDQKANVARTLVDVETCREIYEGLQAKLDAEAPKTE